MALVVATPITGGVQTGMAAPSFTVVADSAVNVNSRRWVVTAVTDAGATPTHTPALPFLVEVTRPAAYKPPAAVNSSTGIATGVTPKNEYRIRVLKGCYPSGGYSQPSLLDINCSIRIPAGTEVAEPAAIRAALSLFIGFFNETSNSAGIGDTLVTGIM